MTGWRETTPRDELPLEPKPSIWARLEDGLDSPILDACLIALTILSVVMFSAVIYARYF